MKDYKDEYILDGFRSFDEQITKDYFYGYCRRAYDVCDYKYQLRDKVGLDFYSLAHEYYIQLLTHEFKPLQDRPKDMKLSTWMMGGFRFVVLDALKAYNKEMAVMANSASEDVLEYVRSTDKEEGMMMQIADAVASHYNDRKMQELAYEIFVLGYKQNEVSKQLGMTPSAINQRYKKMMDEVVTPFVIEYYSGGVYLGKTAMPSCPSVAEAVGGISDKFEVCNWSEDPEDMFKYIKEMEENNRITPEYIHSLQPNEIFVFGSNLHGIHAGGAARLAWQHFGAEMGNGIGIQGQSYAIPTMQGGPETIQPYVDDFIAYAKEHPDKHFLVTAIGCGIAGFEPEEIAPLFREAVEVENISLPEIFWEWI